MSLGDLVDKVHLHEVSLQQDKLSTLLECIALIILQSAAR
jgi:hypothetical protein